LRLIETNQTRTVSTDDQGFFRVTELLVGTYEVRIELSLWTDIELSENVLVEGIVGIQLDPV
jgi:hypothetical protein